ncbi:MAG TPA: hypothetical protein DDW84_01485 [Phycisphaerales bacterium]|nr:MAG: hypothetical protein A2Y13_01280 [Planctomycetes bacterium GWC2_45_44]HBG77509.1 hypothetical protein [Phycisphaerales bacterium]HBR19117.1 hypothetical protein [Phycisphaerales bacterium]
MSSFPTLSVNPDAVGFQQEAATDPTLRNGFENGKVQTRAKFTSVPQKWSFNYSQLSNTDKELIETFERTTVRYGADSFTWVNPVDNASYTVKFGKLVVYTLEDSQQHEWNVQIEIVEV